MEKLKQAGVPPVPEYTLHHSWLLRETNMTLIK